MSRINKSYVFEVSCGYGTTSFGLELSKEEEAYIKEFLEQNGDCDYGYMESENPELFDKINDASNDAIVNLINQVREEDGEEPLGFFDIDWGNMRFDFYYPKELLPTNK